MLPHLDAAYTLARYLLRSEDAAQDAVQEAFLRAVRHFDGYRGDNARAWLLTIVRHCCATARTRGKREDAFVEFDERLHSAHIESATPELHLVRSGAADEFHRALDSLSANDREVLILREVEDLSYEEIARTLGAPIGTVMSRLARARKRIQALVHRESRDAS
ncbi:MAG TPA: sigma-70 family RNA polymerase sigma factor [Gemmatimonadaceae bacterium]|nr:sigma-70 family RNA polymerase sigma factor [Gemmatimonadaceae bacterium]